MRRSSRGAASAPTTGSFADITAWLLKGAARETEMLLLFESFIWRLIAAGIPLDRASLHIGTLHPQLLGFAWNWRRDDATCYEVKVQHLTSETDSFKLNPLARIFATGEPLRRNPQAPEAQAEFPIMVELAESGITDYVALPFSSGAGYRHAMTLATSHPGGFPHAAGAEVRNVLDLFALHVERHIVQRIAENAVSAYLGDVAGRKVLSGSIQRGAGEAIRAVIWMSDLRGFTALSDRLSGTEMIVLLNAYFETLAGAVLLHGGEVLKFMGDGLLAVFPIGEATSAPAAARAALGAAQRAMRDLEGLNAGALPQLDGIDGWRPLRTGIALHEGEVFFGNIGAPERLDFTVIGPAVNEASRVEALQKTLKRDILITTAVARLLDIPLDHLGEHALRGVAAPVAVYSPREAMRRT
ncbi:MAG TPA: adenylate/guanylate cyclase domain-containing protein [Xanthobacteraceae bacterium]|nr:adenylate/guanylate cyclase domain-containing protein [Xanthobacteraceae bacterium]